MRLVNPIPADLARAIRGAALLTNAQVPAAHRLAWVGESVEAESVVYAFAQKPAGYYESTGAGAPGQAVAGLSVAWYTRLDGTKVVHLKYGVTKVTPGRRGGSSGARSAGAARPAPFRGRLPRLRVGAAVHCFRGAPVPAEAGRGRVRRREGAAGTGRPRRLEGARRFGG